MVFSKSNESAGCALYTSLAHKDVTAGSDLPLPKMLPRAARSAADVTARAARENFGRIYIYQPFSREF